MSKVNASYPPRCPPSRLPLSATAASQSTAPKCSSTRWPDHSFGTVKVRRYHSRSSGLSAFITPDSADSIGNGTRICPS